MGHSDGCRKFCWTLLLAQLLAPSISPAPSHVPCHHQHCLHRSSDLIMAFPCSETCVGGPGEACTSGHWRWGLPGPAPALCVLPSKLGDSGPCPVVLGWPCRFYPPAQSLLAQKTPSPCLSQTHPVCTSLAPGSVSSLPCHTRLLCWPLCLRGGPRTWSANGFLSALSEITFKNHALPPCF